LSIISVSAFIKELSMSVCIIFFTSSDTLIIMSLAKYKDNPFAQKAIIIAIGIINIKV
jgi:hypothetical protein